MGFGPQRLAARLFPTHQDVYGHQSRQPVNRWGRPYREGSRAPGCLFSEPNGCWNRRQRLLNAPRREGQAVYARENLSECAGPSFRCAVVCRALARMVAVRALREGATLAESATQVEEFLGKVEKYLVVPKPVRFSGAVTTADLEEIVAGLANSERLTPKWK